MYEREKAVVRVRRARLYVTEKRGRLRVENDSLWLDGVRIVRRTEVRHAYATYEHGAIFVRLTRSRAFGGDVDVAVDDAAEADLLVAALRLDGASSVGEYTLTDGSLRVGRTRLAIKTVAVLFTLAMAEVLLHITSPRATATVQVLVPTFYLLTAIGFGIASASRAVHVSVGSDGIQLRRLTGSQFISFGAIEKVTLRGREIAIALAGGESAELHYASEHRYEASILVDRLEGQRSAHRVRAARRAAAAAHGVEALARRGSSVAEWIRIAASRHERNATFRVGVVPGERLWEIVEDASLPPTARAGAALALRQDLDHTTRARLRSAAEACADPKMRVALESVATAAHESALRRALEPLEDLRGAPALAHARS